VYKRQVVDQWEALYMELLQRKGMEGR